MLSVLQLDYKIVTSWVDEIKAEAIDVTSVNT